jgi:hypothetical protein
MILKRAESGRSCHSTGRAAESILPAPTCEVGESATMPISEPSSGSCLSVSATSPSAPQHPQQQRRQRHRMYLSFILVVGASCLSAEEGHTGDRGALAETNRNLASTRPEPGGVRCRQESCTAREPKVLWYHFGPVGLCHVYDKKRCCAEARESEWARISQVNIRASYACQCDIKDEVGGNLTSVSFRRLLFASNANRAARRGDSNPG